MAIESVKIQNFTVFDDIEIGFSSGINVLIGENGTGKTHLMKFLYIMPTDSKQVSEYFDIPHCDLFRNNKPYDFSINEKLDSKKTFINAKDMLTHSKGFLSYYDIRKVPFDKSYRDIVSKSLLAEFREIPDIGKNILSKIEKIIDGTVIVENETFYILKNNGDKIKFSVEAEGVKKIAILWQLIMNGNIEKGSVLFWDEPEANINPKLIKDVVEILLELSRQGVQIFVATHNYIFAKYIEVLSQKNDEIAFHALYKVENNAVDCETNSNFRDLKQNSIVSSFDNLLEQVYNLNLGE